MSTKDFYPDTRMDVAAVEKKVTAHVDGFFDQLRPLLISFSVHFYGHGFNAAIERQQGANQADKDHMGCSKEQGTEPNPVPSRSDSQPTPYDKVTA